MFTVYHSNQVDILKSLLVELIRLNPLDNPFEKEQILVQSPGMSQWLKLELAKELGVAANIDFPLPATFIWEMFTRVLPDVPKRSAFNKEAMTWKLMTILPTMLDRQEFSPLKQYLEGDDKGAKCYQLAEKIADIFDGYLVYRPEWISAWESDQIVSELQEEQPWQPLLWQALYDHTVTSDQSPYHRANLYQDFIEVLNSFSGTPENLPKRLFVFGITSLPPRYLDALKALGEHIDVHLMFTNPCRFYWGEVRDQKYLARLASKHRQHLVWQDNHSEINGESEQLKGSVEQNSLDELHTDAVGNSLLASMGKLGRDNMYLLSQLESHEIEAFVDAERDTLLQQIQADILNLDMHQNDEVVDTSLHKPEIDIDDRSLTLHLCHSPMREVEVLHDQLLAMFEKNPQLEARDIIVMVSDINAYSPAIQAVFGNAPGKRFIPFSISDRSATQESPLLNAFSQLMGLPDSRCLASELLELLEFPAILARFGIDEEEFLQAKRWVEDAGIRWGLNEETATEFDLPKTKQNTWQFGIQRMLLGYAMPDSAGLLATSELPLAPYNEVQGLGAELAGKLAHFIDKVSVYRQRLAKTQDAESWRTLIFELLEDFFLVELEGELALKTIRDTLGQLNEQLSDAGYTDLLSPEILRQYLNDKLSGTRVSQRFLAGQVNFCTLMPMRSIPFKVVCLLGMNDGIYPRTVPSDGFDLMNGRAKPGDRSRRDDDRYLFLEAILSAQQTLYISYVGRSVQDNSERMPSVLVSELLEYCHQNYCLAGGQALPVDMSGDALLENMTFFHAMTPFSPKAFTQSISYASEWLPAARGEGVAAGGFHQPLTDFWLENTELLELPLAEFQRFWRLPVQYFFNRRLKVHFEAPDALMEDDEPFALNGLESYQMRDGLLEQLLESNSENDASACIDDFVSQQRAQGKLPVGAFGELEFESNRVQVEELVEALRFVCDKPLEEVEVRLDIPVASHNRRVRLTGWLTQHYQAGLVRFRSGRIRSQDYLSAWIDHLAMSAMGIQKRTHLIGYDRKEGVTHWIYPPLEGSQQAKETLIELVRLFGEGMTKLFVISQKPRSLA